MSELIQSIVECSFRKDGDNSTSYEGFIITTTNQEIKLGIGEGQNCCERTGYFITNDNYSEFIGAELLDVFITDSCLIKEKAPDIYEGDTMFVNIETNRGTLQFTAYNEHNGYYAHQAVVISTQLKYEAYL